MLAPWDDYDEDEDEDEEWYHLPDEEAGRELTIDQPQPNILELWFLGSMFFDLGEWDLFPDSD
jgi:hypothetical protein